MSGAWRRVRTLSRAERVLLAKAAAFLLLIRLGLRCLPFSVVQRLLSREERDMSPRAPSRRWGPAPLIEGSSPKTGVDRIAWAVAAAGRRLPGTRCLAEALAVHAMLRRRGYESTLRLGVRAPGSAGTPLDAHAWVECDGALVSGAVDGFAEYVPLSSPDSPLLTNGLEALLRGDAVSWNEIGLTPEQFLQTCSQHELFGLAFQRLSRLSRAEERVASVGAPSRGWGPAPLSEEWRRWQAAPSRGWGPAPLSEEWPKVVREELAREARDAAALELARSREIRSVLARLADNGIRPILLKGTALAYSVYDTPGTRPRTDTDLLIRRDHEEAVRRIMADQGYRATLYSDGDVLFRQFEVRRLDEFGVDHAFDFHWRISTQSAFADMLTYDELAGGAEPIPSLGPHALAPAVLHALLLACIHPVMHHQNVAWPLWIYDIHLLASRLSEHQFNEFADLAVSRNAAAVCARGLTLARASFRTPVPERVIGRLASVVGEPSALYLRPSRSWRHEFVSNLRGFARWSDRLRLVREVLFPSPRYVLGAYGLEVGAVSLALLPALYAHRGIHGAWKILTGKK